MSSATPGRRGVPNGNTVINSAGTRPTRRCVKWYGDLPGSLYIPTSYSGYRGQGCRC